MTAPAPWRRWAVAGAIVATAPVIVISHLVLAPILAVLGLVVLAAAWRGAVRLARPDPVAVALLGMLIVWAAISAAWASDSSDALRGALKLTGTTVAGLLIVAAAATLSDATKRRLTAAVAVFVAVLVVIIVAEVILAKGFDINLRRAPPTAVSGLFWLNRPAAVACVMAWAVAVAFARQRFPWSAGIMLAAGTLGATVGGYTTGLLAMVSGFGVAVATWLFPRSMRLAIAGLSIVFVVAAPLLSKGPLHPDAVAQSEIAFPPSVAHRIYIWAFTSDRIAERPWLGWGMNGAGTVPGGDAPIVDNISHGAGETMPSHPHNMALHAWLELGAPGAVMIALLIGYAFLSAGRAGDRLSASLTLGAVACVVVLAASSFSLWSSSWLASLWLAVAVSRFGAATSIRHIV